MKKLQNVLAVIAILLFLFLLYSHIMVSVRGKQMCLSNDDDFLSEVFEYDNTDGEIARKDALVAGIVNTKKVPLLIGIPTVYREYKNKTAFYINRTINSLLDPLSSEEIESVAILIMLADREAEKRKKVFHLISKQYKRQLQNGLISVIVIPDRFYRSLTNIPSTFNDTSERMYWRSKQSLDYAFIFSYAHTLCDYYMQIEDDVLANEEYFKVVWEDIERFNRRRTKNNKFLLKEHQLRFQPWMTVEYYRTGFIGRLIPSHYLPLYSMFVKTFYNQIPVDWGYPHLARLASGHHPERMAELFEHIGKQSSSMGT